VGEIDWLIGAQCELGIPNFPTAEPEKLASLHCKPDLGGFELPYYHFKKRL